MRNYFFSTFLAIITILSAVLFGQETGEVKDPGYPPFFEAAQLAADKKYDNAKAKLAPVVEMTSALQNYAHVWQQVFTDVEAGKIKDKYLRSIGKSIVYISEKKNKKAAKEIEKAAKKNKKYAPMFYMKGAINELLGEVDMAIESYEAAVKIDPDFARAHFQLGLIFASRELYGNSIAYFNDALAADPTLFAVYEHRALSASKEGQHQATIDDYTKVLEKQPKNAQAYLNRAFAYQYLGDVKKAIADFSAALKTGEVDSVEALYHRGVAHYSQKQYHLAVDDFFDVVEIDPDYTDAYYNRGLAYDELKLYEEALDDFTKTIEFRNNDAKAYFNRGRAYHKKYQYKNALKDYEKAISLDSDYTMAHYYKAVVLDDRKQKKAAKAAYQYFLKMAGAEHAKYTKYAKQRVRKL